MCYFFLYNSAIAVEEEDCGIKHTGNKDFNSRTLNDAAKLIVEYQRQPLPTVKALPAAAATYSEGTSRDNPSS